MSNIYLKIDTLVENIRKHCTTNVADNLINELLEKQINITQQKKSESFSGRTAEILEMIAIGKPALKIYNAIALMYEARHSGLRCSLLELEDGVLLHGGAPSMPKEYCDAVHGLKNGPEIGSCGTSTYTGKRCLVENIETDPKWVDIKAFALPHGMRSCWSEPIINSKGDVLGAFGMYYNYPALPNEEESKDLLSGARLTSIVMERDQVYKRLEQLVNKANNSNQIKSEFLANMSHEIRTPMNAVLGLIHLLLQTNLDDTQKDYAEKTYNSAEHLLGIINDILDFSKIEAGKLELESIVFPLKKVTGNLIDLVKYKADEKGILFVLNVSDDVPRYLKGDPLRYGQVLINLANNAIKFTQSGGTVEIDLTVKEQNESEVVLYCTIRDTGIGISEIAQQKLFQSFSQTDSSTTRKYGGTGLGLVISHELIHFMNGKIWVESKEGKGSLFHFTVKLKKVHDELVIKEQHDIEEDLSKIKGKLENKKILLVEDNKINQLVAKKLLSINKMNVEVANNGQEALELLKNQTFDAILMDCMMPIMDGYEATKNIRSQKQFTNLPIIALTANAMKHDVEKVLSVGMNDHIAKPIKPNTLLITLAKWIRS